MSGAMHAASVRSRLRPVGVIWSVLKERGEAPKHGTPVVDIKPVLA